MPGGARTHKNPYCQCRGCKTRLWKAQAIFESAGNGRETLETKNPESLEPQVIDGDSEGIVVSKFTYGNKQKTRVIDWLNMRASDPKISVAEAAGRMGVSPITLRGYISRAVKDGWLRFEDPISRIEHEIIPRTLDNIAYFLGQKDKTVTIETAKATIYRRYLEDSGIQEGNQLVLALKIETVSPDNVKVISGEVVGKPKDLIGIEVSELEE